MDRWNKSKIGSAETRFQKSVAGFTLLDFKRNVGLRNRLNVCDVNEETENQKSNFY